MAFKMKWRKKPNASYIITSIVSLSLVLYVGSQILSNVLTSMSTINGSVFYTAFTFMGVDTATGNTWATTGIVGVLGLIAVASIVLSFVKVSLK